MSLKKVYIGSIPGHLSEESLLKYFRRLVPTATFCLNKNLQKGTTNSGFGFLTVRSTHDARKIIDTPHIVEGRKLKCQEYLTGSELQVAKQNLQHRRIFVRGLKKGITDQDLSYEFSRYGELESAYVVKIYSTSKTRTFGYVTFKQVEIAQSLLRKGSILVKNLSVTMHPFMKSTNEGEWSGPAATTGNLSAGLHAKNSDFVSGVKNSTEPINSPRQIRLMDISSSEDEIFQNLLRHHSQYPQPAYAHDQEGHLSGGAAPTRGSTLMGHDWRELDSRESCMGNQPEISSHVIKPTSRYFCFAEIVDGNHTAQNIIFTLRDVVRQQTKLRSQLSQ